MSSSSSSSSRHVREKHIEYIKEQRKIARLQNPRLNTHDKDEMS